MNDLKSAFRQLVKNPGFTVVAVLTLALGIGANTGIFSVVETVLLRRPPFPEPERLVVVDLKGGVGALSGGDLRDIQENSDAFSHLAAFDTRYFNLSGEAAPERITSSRVSHDFFATFGVEPLIGRGFSPEEDQPGNEKVAVLSHGLWQRWFGGDRNVIGRSAKLDGESYTVLGIRSFQRLNEVDPGFQPEHLVAVDVSIGGPGRIQLVEQLLARLSDLTGMESSAAVDGLPLDAGRGNMEIALTSIEGSPPTTPDEKLVAGLRLVSPGYFQTMGISLLRGRFFTGRDNTNGPPVVIVNQALAQQYFPGSDPVGKLIGSPDFGPQPCQIVGVINDVKQASLDAIPKPEAFRPLLQECFSGITIVARSPSAPAQVFARVREALTGSDPNLPAYNLRTLDQLVSESLEPRRFALLLMELYAGVALLLALVGIYGVLSCVVNERTREIGIRLALGAQQRDVLAMILMRGMRSVAVGGLIGLAGACALTRFLRGLLYGVSPTDPATLVAVALLLSLVALVACWLPARRATKVDPVEALRYE